MSIYFNIIIKIIIINVIYLFSFNTFASECGVYQLLSNKSSGVMVNENKCEQLPSISIGSVLEMTAKGRLWLKSNANSPDNSSFQMICQNRTRSNMLLEFSENLYPWLSLTGLNNCSGWVGNKISCDGKNGEKDGFFCVISANNAESNNSNPEVERTTSVKMRNLTPAPQPSQINFGNQKIKVLDAIRKDLKICKELNLIQLVYKTNWSLTNSEIKKINVSPNLKQEHNSFSDCISTVIRTFPYPFFTEEVTFKTSF